MLSGSALREALSTVPLHTFEGTLYRAVELRHLPTLLSSIGSLLSDNRYTPKGLSHALYLADGPDQAMLEATRSYQRVFPESRVPAYAVYPVHVDLAKVLDLTREDVLELLATSLMELTGDWRATQRLGQRIPTQELGRAAFEGGLEALKYPSAYHTLEGRANMVLFTEHTARFEPELPASVLEAMRHLETRANQVNPLPTN